MTANRDLDRILREWMVDEGPTQLSDRILDSVLEQIPRVTQRRHLLSRWLLGPNRRSLLFAVAGAAAAIAVMLGIGLFAPSVGGPQESAGPITTISPSPSEVPILPGAANLEGGRYQVWPRTNVSVTLEVPDGWDSHERWAISVPGSWPSGLAFWNPVNLFADPLPFARVPMDPPVGPSVEDFANALATHPGWEAETPRPITVDGHDGLLVRVTVPPEAEIEDCRDFILWYDVSDGRHRCVTVAGAVLDVHVVDVRGERFVFDIMYLPGAPPEEIVALQRVVESIRFDPAP
ncbi:MAG: hypothetical protein ABIW50_09660 [Candidatus Limnocylindria bacterium]